MKIIDTHQHLFYPDHFDYPWTADYPALQGPFTLERYAGEAAGTGIEGTLFMEGDVSVSGQREEARFFCRLAEDPANKLLGVIASGRPENENFAAYVASIRHPKLKGIRRVLHVADDAVSQSALFARNVSLLADAGLTFDLCVRANQLPLAVKLAAQCPGTRFILDHCGVPDVKNRALVPWRDEIAKLAELPNVACKVSGIVAYADPATWTADDLKPFVDHVIASFGWDRVVFGSDWPVCRLAGDLRKWVDAALSLTASATEPEREKLFWKNATKLYRL
jgi:predicted TIM-barrel fold metal-dependent hydrolase